MQRWTQRGFQAGFAARMRVRLGVAALLFAAGPGCDLGSTTPPPAGAPTNVACRAQDGRVDVSWNGVAGAQSYRLDRTVSGVTTTLTASPASVYADFSPPVGTPLSYVIVPVGPQGNGPASAACSVTVSSPGGPAPPAAPSCSPGDGSVRVWWTPQPGIASWRLVRRIAGGPPQQIAETPGSVVTDLALQNAIPHSYTLVAVDGRGRASQESTFCQATPVAGSTPSGVAPAPVAGLQCRGKETKADLTFTPAPDAAFHRIYRTTNGGPEALVGTTAGKVYADFGLELGKTYRWTIESVGAGGRASARSSVCVATLTARGTPPPLNQPPAFTSQPLTSALEDHYYYATASATDPEGQPVTLSLVSGPPGLTLDPATGLLEWTPTTSQIGPRAVELRASDPQGASVTQAFVITVADFNEPPRFTSVPVATRLKIGQGFAYDAEAFDPEGQPLTFAFAASAPPGMTIAPTTGAIGWTPGPGDVGSPVIALRVTDPGGAFATQSFALDVTREPLDLLQPSGAFDLVPGQKLSLQLTANYASASFRVKPELPNAKLLGNAFEFTPDASQVGDFELGFEAVLGEERDVNPVTIRVRRTNRPPSLAAIPAQRVNEGGSLTIPLSATDPDGDPLRFSAPGLSLTNALFDEVQRRLLFAPAFDQAGTYAVTVAVSDGRATVQQVVDIVVDDAPPPQNVTDLVLDPVPSPTFVGTQTISGSTKGQAQSGPSGAGPLVVGLAPTNLRQGRRSIVDVTGLRTQFQAGSVAADFGDGVTVEKVDVVSPTQLQVTVAAALDATVGVRSVRVSNGGVEAPSVVAFSIEAGAAELSGILLDSFTNQPLVGARVTVQGATGVSVVTDAQGRFQLTGVPPGEQALVVVAPNYAVKRIPVSVTANATVDLGTSVPIDALARPFNPGGTLPRAATLASVLDRGVGVKDGDLDFEQARALVVDTMLALGGRDVGVLDDAGRQLNPNLASDGLLSITPGMVDYLAGRMVRGENYTLGELAFIIDGSLGWAFDGGFPPEALETQLQRAARAAWASPGDPLAGWAIALLNEGRNLDPAPPEITSETRFNAFQAFLLLSSQLLVNLDVLNEKVDALLVKKGLDPKALLQQQGFPAAITAYAPAEGGAWRALAGWTGGAAREIAAHVLPSPAWAQTPPAPVKPPPNTVQAPKKQEGGWAAVGRALGPAAVSSLLPALVAAAFTLLLVLIAFVAGGPILGIAAATGGFSIAAAFGFSFLSAFVAKLLVAGLADPNAAANFAPVPASRTQVVAGIDPTTGQRKAKIVFRKSNSELERDRKLGLGQSYNQMFNTDVFDITLTEVDPKYLDFRYQLFRFDDPNPPLEFKPGKAELLSLRPVPVPGKPELQKFVIPAEALKNGDNWLGVVTVQFYRQMWTTLDPDGVEANRVAYPDLGVPPSPQPLLDNVLGNVANEGGETLTDAFSAFLEEPKLHADPRIQQAKDFGKQLYQQRQVAMLAQQAQNDVALAQKGLSSATRAHAAAIRPVIDSERALRGLKNELSQAFTDRNVVIARQKVNENILAWLADPATKRQDFSALLADLRNPLKQPGQSIEAVVAVAGSATRADAELIAQRAWEMANVDSTLKSYKNAKASIDLALVELEKAEQVVANQRPFPIVTEQVKVPRIVPGTDALGEFPRLSGVADEIKFPLLFDGTPASLTQLRDLKLQLQIEKARLGADIKNFGVRQTQAKSTLISASNKLSADIDPGGQKIAQLRQAVQEAEIEAAKHKQLLQDHRANLDIAEKIAKSEEEALEKISQQKNPAKLRSVSEFQAPKGLAKGEIKALGFLDHPAAPGAGEAFGVILDVGSEAYQARDGLAVLRSQPSNLFLVQRVNGQVVVPQQPVQTASYAPPPASSLVRIVQPLNVGPAWPEPRDGPSDLADLGALAAIDPFRAALRPRLALHDSGEPAGLSEAERVRATRRSDALERHGIGARFVQYTGGAGFPVQFETDPDVTNNLAILRPTPPALPNPKAGYLVRDYPFTGPDTEVIDAGFPSDLIATDSKGRAYLLNLNSTDQFGGRIFRYGGDPLTREHVGSMTYYSLSLQYAKPTTGIAMEIGEFYDGAKKVENLFVAELDSGAYFNSNIQPQNKILRLPIDQADTLPFYANGQNRNRLVGQPWATHPDFQMTGPSDMEADSKLRHLDPRVPANLYFSDEENVFVLSDVNFDGQAEVGKVLSVPGRRWSGLAVDAAGNLFAADWNRGEIYLVPSNELDLILLQNVPIQTDAELDRRAYLIKESLFQPGDVELDTNEQRYLVSTPGGFQAFNVPIVGRLVTEIAEMHVDIIGREVPVTIRKNRGNIFFAGATSEGPFGQQVRIRIRRVDPVTRTSSWSNATYQTSPFGASVLPNGL